MPTIAVGLSGTASLETAMANIALDLTKFGCDECSSIRESVLLLTLYKAVAL